MILCAREVPINSTDSAPEPVLRILLFGTMSVSGRAANVGLPKLRKTRAVLAILALRAPEPVPRAQVTGLLWSQRDPLQARASLRQALHELHDALGHDASAVLLVDRAHLALDKNRIWIDVTELRRATPRAPDALAMYRPNLLNDLGSLDAAFDRWLEAERQKLGLLARGLGEAVLAATHPNEVLAAAENLLAIDPAHEAAWRAVMAAHGRAGDRTAAADAFARCERALADQAGLVPSRETIDLAHALREDRGRSEPSPSADSVAPRLVALRPRSTRESTNTRLRIGIMPPRAPDGGRAAELSLGLAEEITTALAPFRGLSCVASSSLAAVAGEARDASAAWRALDLDFLLEGTIQLGPTGVRVMARLLDRRAADEVVWARRFDRSNDDILALQDEIASAIVGEIAPELMVREGERAGARRHPHPTSYELTLRAIPAIYRLDEATFHVSGELLEEALRLDPGNAAAHTWLAYWNLLLVGQGWADNAVAATRRAGALSERAVMLDPGDARALTLAGHVRGFLDRKAREARALHDRALAINPNLALAWCLSGLAHCYCGEHEEAVRRIAQAQALSPHDPHGFFFDGAMVYPLLLRRQHELAAEIGRRGLELNKCFSSGYKGLLSALGHLGEDEEAAERLAQLLRLEPVFSVEAAVGRSPLLRAEDRLHYAEGLRKAGLRETGPGWPACRPAGRADLRVVGG